MKGHRLWVIVGLWLLLGSLLGSCNLFKKTPRTDNGGTVTLDPISTNNSQDTGRTGPYNPVTRVDPPVVVESDTSYFCDTLQATPSRRIVVCFEKIGNRFIKADTVAILDLYAPVVVQPTTLDTTIQTKLAYQVAVLLPFMSNRFVPASGREIPLRSIKAVEFYEGMLMAFDSLKREGVSLFVHVFDTQRDTNVVKRLLSSRALQEADLIVGPVTSSNLRLVAEFGKTYKKTVVSPLNDGADLTTNNPYFIQVNPSFEVHARYMVDLLDRVARPNRFRTQVQERNYLILALERDSARVATLQRAYATATNRPDATLPTLIRKGSTIDISNIKPLLKSNQLNVIVMPTYHDESFVYNSLRELQKLIDKVERNSSYELAIIGMDRWRYYNRINFDYYEDLNVHLTSAYYTPKTGSIQGFRDSYKALYGTGSREFSLKGFDIMLYFGRMLQRYGVTFQAHLWKVPAIYRHTTFRLQPRYHHNGPSMERQLAIPDEVGSIFDYYENAYLHVLEFDAYDLNKMEE